MKVETRVMSRWITSVGSKAGKVPVHKHLEQMFSVVPGKIELDGGRIKLDVAFLERRVVRKELFQMRITFDLEDACVDLDLDELSDHLFDHVAAEITDILPPNRKAAMNLFSATENDLSRVQLTINIEPLTLEKLGQ
jgi:hypothetical protein